MIMQPSFLHDFSSNPTGLSARRSTFDRNCRIKTSFNEGKLIPFFCDEVLPGDTFNVKTSVLARLSNPAVRPVMDDMYLDVYYFFVPSRILWKHFPEVHGENVSGYWAAPSEVVCPSDADQPVLSHSVYDYLGVPPGCSSSGLNPLPVIAYYKVWGEWFRDENLTSPIVQVETFFNAASGSVFDSGGNATGSLLSVSRYHDYFSSCLPAPQKGSAVSLPLGTTAPVSVTTQSQNLFLGPSGQVGTAVTYTTNTGNNGYLYVDGTNLSVSPTAGTGTADLSQATAANINELRQAFQLQRLFERDARGGTRYTEMLHAHFGVTNPDARLQRPEYLGGEHILLNMTQVQQTAPSSGSGNALGQLGAYSLTGAQGGAFVKSFTEFGYVLGLACVRVKHSYSQGIPRMFTRKRRFDFYYPGLANIGEQPVYTSELYTPAGSAFSKANVFGFQEAWADYRYKPDLVTGMLRPGQTADMTAWTYGDNYTAAPTLSDGWVKESTGNIDQTLAVPAATADQFIADFGVYNKCTRVMPLFSVPGLIDQN